MKRGHTLDRAHIIPEDPIERLCLVRSKVGHEQNIVIYSVYQVRTWPAPEVVTQRTLIILADSRQVHTLLHANPL